MEPPCWCIVHQYSSQKSTRTSGIHLATKALIFAHEIKCICMNTSSNVLETLILLKFISMDKVTIRKFKMPYFRDERRHGTGNLTKYLSLGRLQPPIDKNSKHLAI